MRNLIRALVLLLVLPFFATSEIAADSMTWQEHREAAKAQLRYRLADPVTPTQHLEKALNLARNENASPAEIGDLMDQLAQAHIVYGGSQEKWEKLLLAALQYKEATLGKQAPELVPTLRELSSLRFSQQRTLESLQLLARALSIQTHRFGAKSAQAAEGTVLLGLTLEAAGDAEQAETLLRRAVEIVRAVPNPPDEIAFGVLANASAFLHKRGRIEEAEALQREAVPAMERVLAKERREAKDFEQLPRAPYPSDVETLNEEELAAAVAAGLVLVEPPVQREFPH